MRIWLRIFILAASVALVSTGVTGILAARAGYRAQLDAEVRALLRMADDLAGQLTNEVRTAAYLSRPAPTALIYLQQLTDQLPGEVALEIYNPDLQPLLSTGHAVPPPAVAVSSELAAVAGGRPPTWLLRWSGEHPLVYLAVRESIAGEPFIFRVSSSLPSLTVYSASQGMLLGLAALGAVVLLGFAAYVGSRAITRGLEALTVRATAIASGDYSARAVAGGRDEVAQLGSEINRMATAVAASIHRLEHEKESRQSFIDELTHEVRTPVTAIVGFADHLRRHAWDERLFTEGLTRIHDEGIRILAVVEGLKRLLLSRTGADARTDVEVGGILSQAAADARQRHAGHRFAVTVEGGTRLSLDRDLMLAALANLLDNAAHASPPGSTIALAWERDAAGARIVVRDPGGASGSAAKGLGLGKAICREIAEYHGARLEYASRAGGGTAASIVF
jgi:signal transduction histidine kinase